MSFCLKHFENYLWWVLTVSSSKYFKTPLFIHIDKALLAIIKFSIFDSLYSTSYFIQKLI